MQTRIVVLADAWDLLKFLNDDEFALDEKAAAKELRAEAVPVLDAALSALEGVDEWKTDKIEEALKVALLENLAVKPRKAFGPIRVAATGASISPPLFESLELLGRDRSLHRLTPVATVRRRQRPRRVRKRREIFGNLHVGPASQRTLPVNCLRSRKMACDQRLQVADGVWCNWQHSGFWYRHSRFESWYPSAANELGRHWLLSYAGPPKSSSPRRLAA